MRDTRLLACAAIALAVSTSACGGGGPVGDGPPVSPTASSRPSSTAKLAIVAPKIGAPDVREPLTRFTRPFNTTGHPVICLPAPVSGLPVGIQVVGHLGQESRLVEVALALEKAWSRD
jgi:Asp-tRNA(Asn)/Glu-tRNA(Gln) amidotransferase A subunit family amidase